MISAILLAAGQSKRMRGKNKLTKKIDNIPLIKYSIKNILESSVDELIIVLGYQKKTIKKTIEEHSKIKFVFNPNFEKGMSSSIKTGLTNLSKSTEAFFISLADMPYVTKNVYNELIQLKKNNKEKDIFVPYYKEQQGNPILFSIRMKESFNKIEGDNGAKNLLLDNSQKIFRMMVSDKSIIMDFDTEENFK
tara:strand:- start:194 stop:769 length:576 start_codon:yes stop_codon:yes gene_type:complete